MHKKGKEVLISWQYIEDRETIQETGKDFADIADVPFEFVSYTV